MNVAGKDLCGELYSLSGWFHPTRNTPNCAEYTWIKRKHAKYGYCWSRAEAMDYMLKVGISKLTYYLPGYTTGYLLRKLPRCIERDNQRVYLSHNATFNGMWCSRYVDAAGNTAGIEKQLASTPEDSVTLLAIHLIKEGLIDVGEK